MSSFTIINLQSSGISSAGKARQGVRAQMLRDFNNNGIQAREVTLEEALKENPAGDGINAALLFYNELSLVKGGKADWLRERQGALTDIGYQIIHPVEQGTIIGAKSRQNEILTAAGVLMPRRQTGAADTPVFSNAETAAHVPTLVLEAGSTLNERRYNAEYIDSKVEVNGEEYFVCIRTLAVGYEAVISWIRARPASEGDPSVHSRDTPVDHNLIQELHDKIITPNRHKLSEISRAIHRALGFGYFCHDIIPCARSGRLYVCETNYKFYDANYKFHLSEISEQHPQPLLWRPRRIARHLVRKTIEQIYSTD